MLFASAYLYYSNPNWFKNELPSYRKSNNKPLCKRKKASLTEKSMIFVCGPPSSKRKGDGVNSYFGWINLSLKKRTQSIYAANLILMYGGQQ
jgi:hypothetical protein